MPRPPQARALLAATSLALAFASPALAQPAPTVQVTAATVTLTNAGGDTVSVNPNLGPLPLFLDLTQPPASGCQAVFTFGDYGLELIMHPQPGSAASTACVDLTFVYTPASFADVTVFMPARFNCGGDVRLFFPASDPNPTLASVSPPCGQGTLTVLETTTLTLPPAPETFRLRACATGFSIAQGVFLFGTGVAQLQVHYAGGCCAPDATCTLRTVSQCQLPNVYLGDSTACAADPPCPVRACCYADGRCDLQMPAGCTGVSHAEATACAPDLCPPPSRLFAIIVGGGGGHHANPVLDALAIKASLVRFQGVDPANVHITTSTLGIFLAAAQIFPSISPNDTLMFVYSGHGGFCNDGACRDESPIPLGLLESAWCLNTYGVNASCSNNEGDNFLCLSGVGDPSIYAPFDMHQLASILDATARPGTKKIVIISACFSGGFWRASSHLPTLAQLADTAFVASSDGGHFSYSVSGSGDPPDTLRSALMISFEQALNSFPADQGLPPVADLVTALNARYTSGVFGSLLLATPFAPTFDTDIPVSNPQLSLFTATSPGFDTPAPLSNPAVWCGPTFDTHPASITACPYSPASFSASAHSQVTPFYQWQREVPAGPWPQFQQLTAADGVSGAQFGSSMAISGNTLVVGAPSDQVAGHGGQGSAYVFVRSGGSWSLQGKLTANDGAAEDRFGYSVAIDGDTIVVGVPEDDFNPSADEGSAYVFVRSGATWTQQAKLSLANRAFRDYFGQSVAVSGDTALVCAFDRDIAGHSNQGAAYVFTRTGSTWTQQAELVASDGANSDEFGFSSAILGDTVLIGAWDARIGSNSSQGAAYVFTRSGSAWTQQAKLAAPDGQAFDEFGISVALAQDTVVVGAWDHDSPTNNSTGAAYVFVRSGTTWSHQTTLTAGDAASGDEFGYSVAISGNRIISGAPYKRINGNSSVGAAYVFVRDAAGAWAQEGQPLASDGLTNDTLGYSVAISGDSAAAGARGRAVAGHLRQGAAYVFNATGNPAWVDLADAPITGGPATASGTSTQTLSLTNFASLPQPIRVRCRAFNQCASSFSASATLRPCPADHNCTGTLEVADIFSFLNAWFAGSSNADFDGANGLQVGDIFAFLNAWFMGC